MNTLVIVLIAAVCLIAGLLFIWPLLANKWGIDPNAKTPAVLQKRRTGLCSGRWSDSLCPSVLIPSPVQALSPGAIQAAVFGWVPVLLWILIGGIFFRVPLQTLVHYMPVSKMTVSPWDF